MNLNVEQPSYGFSIEKLTSSIIITIPERFIPGQEGVRAFLGCGYFIGVLSMMMVGALAGGGLFDSVGGAIFGSIVAICVFGMIYYASDRKQYSANGIAKEAVKLTIDGKNISINNKAYIRSHVKDWTIRWEDIVGPSRNAAKMKSEHNYSITFNYGDKNILVAGAMTKAGSSRLMEAINNSLSEIVEG